MFARYLTFATRVVIVEGVVGVVFVADTWSHPFNVAHQTVFTSVSRRNCNRVHVPHIRLPEPWCTRRQSTHTHTFVRWQMAISIFRPASTFSSKRLALSPIHTRDAMLAHLRFACTSCAVNKIKLHNIT